MIFVDFAVCIYNLESYDTFWRTKQQSLLNFSLRLADLEKWNSNLKIENVWNEDLMLLLEQELEIVVTLINKPATNTKVFETFSFNTIVFFENNCGIYFLKNKWHSFGINWTSCAKIRGRTAGELKTQKE